MVTIKNMTLSQLQEAVSNLENKFGFNQVTTMEYDFRILGVKATVAARVLYSDLNEQLKVKLAEEEDKKQTDEYNFLLKEVCPTFNNPVYTVTTTHPNSYPFIEDIEDYFANGEVRVRGTEPVEYEDFFFSDPAPDYTYHYQSHREWWCPLCWLSALFGLGS